MRRAWLVVLLVPLVLGAGCLKSFDEPSRVNITTIDLSPERVLSSTVELNLTTYLDNAGGGTTGALRLLAKAYSQDTGFLIAHTEDNLTPLPGLTTRGVTQQLAVPREGSIRIDITLFEDGHALRVGSITARNLGVLKPDVFETGLKIGEMDFTVEEVVEGARGNGTRVRIEAGLYFTNEATTPSEDLRVQVKARETPTQLVADTQWLTTGTISPGTTIIRTTNLTVPDGYNYIVEILTWRGDVIVDRAEGRVQLAPTFVVPKDQEFVVTNPNVNDFIRPPTSPTATPGYPQYGAPDSATGVPSITLVASLVAVAIAALVARGRKKQ